MKGAGVIGQNVVSTRAGKAARTEQYKEWLANADLIFAIPSYNLTVKEVFDLRKAMPEGTKVSDDPLIIAHYKTNKIFALFESATVWARPH